MKQEASLQSQAQAHPGVETAVVNVLRVGVWFSAACMGAGLAMVLAILAFGGSVDLDFAPQTVAELGTTLLSLRPISLLTLGLFGLIVTQVLMLLNTLKAFTRIRDNVYTGITLFILLILALGVVMGQR